MAGQPIWIRRYNGDDLVCLGYKTEGGRMAKKDHPIGKLRHILAGYMENAIRNTLRDISQSALASGKKAGETAEVFWKESQAVQVNPPARHPKQAGQA